MEYAKTRICFVTAHLAAGFTNYEERNRDYQTIAHGLRFQWNRSIDEHDAIIWFGDFNYRIGLSDERVRGCLERGDLATLYQNDQLNIQMVAGRTFPFFTEAKINFHPTYKYDNGTDNYDTSEKARIPAYTDRVLSRGNNLRQTGYGVAALKFSDHRPVHASFSCIVDVEDSNKRKILVDELYHSRSAQLRDMRSGSPASEPSQGSTLEDSFSPFRKTLVGSEQRKWWLADGNDFLSNSAFYSACSLKMI